MSNHFTSDMLALKTLLQNLHFFHILFSISESICCLAWKWFTGKNQRNCPFLLSAPPLTSREDGVGGLGPGSSPEVAWQGARCTFPHWKTAQQPDSGRRLAPVWVMEHCCVFVIWLGFKIYRLYEMTPLSSHFFLQSLMRTTSPVWCGLYLWGVSTVLFLVPRWTLFQHTKRNLFWHSLWLVR
jgi:hypothetical protein